MGNADEGTLATHTVLLTSLEQINRNNKENCSFLHSVIAKTLLQIQKEPIQIAPGPGPFVLFTFGEKNCVVVLFLFYYVQHIEKLV